jgi:hypothetical protein
MLDLPKLQTSSIMTWDHYYDSGEGFREVIEMVGKDEWDIPDVADNHPSHSHMLDLLIRAASSPKEDVRSELQPFLADKEPFEIAQLLKVPERVNRDLDDNYMANTAHQGVRYLRRACTDVIMYANRVSMSKIFLQLSTDHFNGDLPQDMLYLRSWAEKLIETAEAASAFRMSRRFGARFGDSRVADLRTKFGLPAVGEGKSGEEAEPPIGGDTESEDGDCQVYSPSQGFKPVTVLMGLKPKRPKCPPGCKLGPAHNHRS